MTDHHQPDNPKPELGDVLYEVREYQARTKRRRLLLVDLPARGLTLVDIVADAEGEPHIVADRVANLAEAGEASDQHVAASIALGRPAVPTAEPPTSEQLRYLRRVAATLGQAFAPPRSKAEAEKRIRRCSPSRWAPAYDLPCDR